MEERKSLNVTNEVELAEINKKFINKIPTELKTDIMIHKKSS